MDNRIDRGAGPPRRWGQWALAHEVGGMTEILGVITGDRRQGRYKCCLLRSPESWFTVFRTHRVSLAPAQLTRRLTLGQTLSLLSSSKHYLPHKNYPRCLLFREAFPDYQVPWYLRPLYADAACSMEPGAWQGSARLLDGSSNERVKVMVLSWCLCLPPRRKLFICSQHPAHWTAHLWRPTEVYY